jgi:hypothetical protein
MLHSKINKALYLFTSGLIFNMCILHDKNFIVCITVYYDLSHCKTTAVKKTVSYHKLIPTIFLGMRKINIKKVPHSFLLCKSRTYRSMVIFFIVLLDSHYKKNQSLSLHGNCNSQNKMFHAHMQIACHAFAQTLYKQFNFSIYIISYQ